MIKLDVLDSLPGIRHGFMTRAGGVSEGIYASLNCGLGSDDDRERVLENRRRVLEMAGIPAKTLLTAHQVHSPDVLVVEEEWQDGPRPKVDALVTRRANLAIAASSADCVPILFAEPAAGVAGAATAGWRGAVGGVLQATVKEMCALGARPERIRAGVGPCIGPASYEVGREFVDRFLAHDPGSEHFFYPADTDDGGEKARFDLPGFVLWRLEQAGVQNCEWTGHDTCEDEARFFSNRRAFKRGEPDYGRMISCIALT
jgi:YfiH family protein